MPNSVLSSIYARTNNINFGISFDYSCHCSLVLEMSSLQCSGFVFYVPLHNF